MEQLGKLFGKKSRNVEPEAGQGSPDAAQPPEPSPLAPQPGSQAQAPLPGAASFGINLVLETGEARLFTSLPIHIGRSDHNDLVLARETVSGVHAMVYFDESLQAICIQDQDSLNGMLVERLPTRRNVLQDGMQISLGDAVITFRDTGYIHQP